VAIRKRFSCGLGIGLVQAVRMDAAVQDELEPLTGSAKL
jgi:hypothetical protein